MSDATVVAVFGFGGVALLIAMIVVRQVRVRQRVAAAGSDAIRVRLRANRYGYAGGLVPVAEELLERVEVLEREVAALKDRARD